MFHGAQQYFRTNWPAGFLVGRAGKTLLLRQFHKYSGKPGDGRHVLPSPPKFFAPVHALFCCNSVRVTIFTGTCAPLAPLR